MEYGALISESIDYTRETLVGNWTTWLILILCYLPIALVRFVYDPKKILAGGTIHWELIPWPELIVLILAGFLLMILLFGYTVRLYRGINPPVFNNWDSLYLDGIKLLIVNILWFVPFVLISIALLVLLFPLVFSIGPDSIGLWLGCMLAALLVAFMPLVIAFLYSTLGSIRYARTGSIREGIRFSVISSTIRAIGWGTYILALFLLQVAVIMFATLCAVAGPFVILTGAAAGFYILAGFVSRTGSFPHMISAIGWGMVPLAIYEAVRIPLLLAYLPGMSLTVSPDLFTLYKSPPFAFSSGSAALADMFTYNQVFYSVAVANAILHVLAYFACAWFWVPAVRHTCAVKYRHAVVIVLIPLLLFLALSFGSGLISGHFSV